MTMRRPSVASERGGCSDREPSGEWPPRTLRPEDSQLLRIAWQTELAARVVIGCVYRRTSPEVISALLPLDCRIVVDRQQRVRDPLEQMHREGGGVSSMYFRGFKDVSVPDADGRVPVIGPGSPMPDRSRSAPSGQPAGRRLAGPRDRWCT